MFNLPVTKINRVTNMAQFPRVISQLLEGRLITFESSIMALLVFTLDEVGTLDMVLSFLHGMLLPRLSVLNLQGCLIYHNVIPQNIVSDQGTRITAKVRWWVHVHGTHWSFHIPTNLKQLLEGSFEVLQHHISGNTLLARNKVCQKAL